MQFHVIKYIISFNINLKEIITIFTFLLSFNAYDFLNGKTYTKKR